MATPENQDLLSPTNRVRAIITKQALQEGWDCPFAYVLCSLSASHSAAALTQLVGRILRQPGAQKTGVQALDECYVVTHHADTARVVTAIKEGLEQDGLADLVERIPRDFKSAERQMRRIRLVDAGGERIIAEVAERTGERLDFDPAYAVRMVSDLVPNAWIAREIIGAFIARLARRGFAEELLGRLHGRRLVVMPKVRHTHPTAEGTMSANGGRAKAGQVDHPA